MMARFPTRNVPILLMIHRGNADSITLMTVQAAYN